MKDIEMKEDESVKLELSQEKKVLTIHKDLLIYLTKIIQELFSVSTNVLRTVSDGFGIRLIEVKSEYIEIVLKRHPELLLKLCSKDEDTFDSYKHLMLETIVETLIKTGVLSDAFKLLVEKGKSECEVYDWFVALLDNLILQSLDQSGDLYIETQKLRKVVGEYIR